MTSENRVAASDRLPILTLVMQVRFAVLLSAFLLLFVTLPVVEMIGTQISPVFIRLVIGIAFVAMVCSAVYAVSENRRTRRIVVVLGAPAILLGIFDIGLRIETIHVLGHAFMILFLGYTIVVVLRFLFQSEQVTANAIFASLCIYLMLGTLWAFLYALVEALVPGSFNYAAHEMQLNAPLDVGGTQTIFTFYFSFVTMTTLGYGDIVPISSSAKMLTVVQAVTGQLYLTVLVARLVGLQIAHSRAGRGASQRDKPDGS